MGPIMFVNYVVMQVFSTSNKMPTLTFNRAKQRHHEDTFVNIIY